MALIPQAVSQRCISLGFSVLDGTLSANDAVAEAVPAGMNPTSARDTIYVVGCMAKGQRYTRGLSAAQTDFALSEFHARKGIAGLQTALQALDGHITYYEGIRAVTMHGLRYVHAKFSALVVEMPTLETLLTQSAAAVSAARALWSRDHQSRLPQPGHKPQRVTATTATYLRNPYVVAEVLYRAGGQCGHCHSPAPFTKHSDQTPYLEVHHRTPLAENGDDTVENAIALCPNCHREAHLGTLRENFKR